MAEHSVKSDLSILFQSRSFLPAAKVPEFEAMSAAGSTFLNIGPTFGLAGPYDSYHAFP